MNDEREITAQGLSIISSTVTATADGKVALVFDTIEAGLIGFPLNLEGIAQLKDSIATAEAFLRQGVAIA